MFCVGVYYVHIRLKCYDKSEVIFVGDIITQQCHKNSLVNLLRLVFAHSLLCIGVSVKSNNHMNLMTNSM